MAPVPSSINWQGSFEVLAGKLRCSALPTQPVDSAHLTFHPRLPGNGVTHPDHPHQGLWELTQEDQPQGSHHKTITPSTHRLGTAPAPCPKTPEGYNFQLQGVFTSFAAANEAGHNYTVWFRLSAEM